MSKSEENQSKTIANSPLIAALLILLALITLFFTLFRLSQPQNLLKKAQFVTSLPLKVKVSNIYPNGFTVSWVTNEKTNGAVVYSDNQEKVNDSSAVKIYDEKGQDHLSFFHNVNLKNLTPGKKYYFKVISGETSFYKSLSEGWNSSGIPETISLPNLTFSPSLPFSETNPSGSFSNESAAFSDCPKFPEKINIPCFRTNPIYGQANNEDGSSTQALVFLEIPGKSNIISTLSDENGKWSLDLANLLKTDFSGRVIYQPQVDLIKISAIGIRGAESSLYKPIPRVGKFQDQTNPVNFSLPIIPEPTPTQAQPTSPPSISPSATPTPTPTSPPAVKLTLMIKLENIESRAPNKNVTVTLKKDIKNSWRWKTVFSSSSTGDFSGNIFTNLLGSYSLLVKPDNYLRKDLGPVNLTKGASSLSFTQTEFLAGDLNNDNVVNSLDLSLLLNEINNQSKKTSADFNNDGKVDALDLAILTANYRKEGE